MLMPESCTSTQLILLKVYAHIIGTSQEDDILVYHDKDETSFLDISNTKDMVKSVIKTHDVTALQSLHVYLRNL
jgi:protease II